MRSHNKILAVAITTALSTSFSNLYANQQFITECIVTDKKIPIQFENVGDKAEWAACVIKRAGEALLDPSTPAGTKLTRPNNVFDFTAGESVVYNGVGQTTGVSYAAELFGGSLTLPAPITTGSTPDYLGVIYTIDGKIPTDFVATFTLDNGAAFTSAILGVRDDKAGLNALAAAVAQGDKTATVSGVGVDTVFRFDNHATVYLGTAVTAAVAPAVDTVNFYQLGVLNAATPSLTGAATLVAAGLKVYTKTGAAATPAVKSSAVTTITALGGLTNGKSTSPATISVSDATKLKTGWTYACDTVVASGNATTGTVGAHLFTVTSTPTTATSAVTIAVATPATTWAVTGAATGWSTTFSFGDPTPECAVGASIYRIHVPGDTVISLEGTTTTTFSPNKFYTFDVATPANCNLANVATSTQYKVTTTTGADNSITITPALATPLCAGMKGYLTDISLSDQWNTTSGPMTPKPPITSTAGKSATFVMNASKAPLQGGDQLMLLYQMTDVGILADPTQKINMTIDLNTGGKLATIVNPQRTVTVATSAKALNVSLASLEAGKLNVSVSSGSTQFSGDIAPSPLIFYGYVNNTTARIGQLKFNIKASTDPTAPKMADAVTPFALASDKVAADSSKLVITGGQFQASKSIPGSVELRLYDKDGNPGSSITSDEITMDIEGAWQATWNLDSTDLSNIAGSANGAMIEMVVDGASEVNSVENPPEGYLIIDFNSNSYKDIPIEKLELRKITKDGNVCTVYNVPPPSNGVMGADVGNIRVTNDSAIAGKLMGKFYGMDGTLMWTGDLLGGTELAPGVTARLESDGLAKLMGITWEGRGVLQISSTIPEMEVMTLIRQNGIKFAPLGNLSSGARGNSCTQQ